MTGKKQLSILFAALLSMALISGVALAAGQASGTQAGQKPALTPAEQAVVEQIGDLKRQHRERLQAEIKSLLDQAVQSGKISRERADQFLTRRGKGHWSHDKGGPATLEELKVKLDAAVQSGKLTREQADRMIQRWQQRHSQTR